MKVGYCQHCDRKYKGEEDQCYSCGAPRDIKAENREAMLRKLRILADMTFGYRDYKEDKC